MTLSRNILNAYNNSVMSGGTGFAPYAVMVRNSYPVHIGFADTPVWGNTIGYDNDNFLKPFTSNPYGVPAVKQQNFAGGNANQVQEQMNDTFTKQSSAIAPQPQMINSSNLNAVRQRNTAMVLKNDIKILSDLITSNNSQEINKQFNKMLNKISKMNPPIEGIDKDEHKEAMKAMLKDAYQEATGVSIENHIRSNVNSTLKSGFVKGLTLAIADPKSAEEVISEINDTNQRKIDMVVGDYVAPLAGAGVTVAGGAQIVRNILGSGTQIKDVNKTVASAEKALKEAQEAAKGVLNDVKLSEIAEKNIARATKNLKTAKLTSMAVKAKSLGSKAAAIAALVTGAVVAYSKIFSDDTK